MQMLGSWTAIRQQFDQLSPELIHMSSFFLASHPRAVREVIEKHRRSIDAYPYTYIENNIMRMPSVMRMAARPEYLGGRPDEVAFTNSTTMGLSLVYRPAAGRRRRNSDDRPRPSGASRGYFLPRGRTRGRNNSKDSSFDDIQRVSAEDIENGSAKRSRPKRASWALPGFTRAPA